jgi:rubredoxin
MSTATFPNHHPDPSDPHNLEDLILSVQSTGADLGIAFDGDGDRLGVVTKSGEIIYPDRLLMLFARDVLSRQPGATIIYDVKCTGHLKAQILDAGGSPLMWRTGHSLIKAKMRETGAELAGEMSGHFFFKERWYGFDDGIYAAARLLEILGGDLQGRTPEEIFATLPKNISTPELKVELAEGEHYRFMDKLRQQASFGDATLITIDGVRADWPDGWGLVRASNTTPVLVLRFEADNAVALKRIQQVFRKQLNPKAVDFFASRKEKMPFTTRDTPKALPSGRVSRVLPIQNRRSALQKPFMLSVVPKARSRSFARGRPFDFAATRLRSGRTVDISKRRGEQSVMQERAGWGERQRCPTPPMNDLPATRYCEGCSCAAFSWR